MMKYKLQSSFVYSSRFMLRQLYFLYKWILSGYSQPSPWIVKMKILRRHMIRDSLFVETGTWFGDTALFMSDYSNQVITIEPDKKLFEKSKLRLAHKNNIQVINISSENYFYNIGNYSGAINFWLDGHYSGEGTFMNKLESPIRFELSEIEKNLARFTKIVVLVDDFRLFGDNYDSVISYPDKSFLVDWSVKNGFSWTVENDIFIAKNFL